MSQSPTAHASYTIETSDAEYKRLEDLANANAEYVRDGCRRVGLQPGASVVDVGCGAPGALLPFADVVGPRGRVMGMDINTSTVAKAQEIVKRHKISNIAVIHADINTVDPATVCPPGGVDLAYCHLMLMHQADPVATLRQMAALVRSGGHVLLQEIVLDPRCAEPPWISPAVPALQQWYRVTAEAIRHAGGHPETAQSLDEIVTAARLQPLRQHAYSMWAGSGEAAQLLQSVIDTLRGMRAAIVARELATDADVAGWLEALTAAQSGTYQTFLGLLYVEMIAQVP